MVKKIVLCGDPAVGKTSLIRRFVTGKYDEKYISTMGSVVSKKTIANSLGDTNVKMMVWDISGQDEFKRVHASGFSDAHGGIAVCDLSRPKTIDHVRQWLSDLRRHAGPKVPAVILTNKFDLVEADPRKVIKAHVELKTHGCRILQTSAKTGHNVENAFQILVDAILMDISNPAVPRPDFLKLPEKFNSGPELLDYISIRFCMALGDQEMGMYILRKQLADMKIDFQKITREEAKNLIVHLIKVIEEILGVGLAKEFRKDLIKAHSRLTK
jgi:Ras-related protein Rab-6A